MDGSIFFLVVDKIVFYYCFVGEKMDGVIGVVVMGF